MLIFLEPQPQPAENRDMTNQYAPVDGVEQEQEKPDVETRDWTDYDDDGQLITGRACDEEWY